MSLLRLFYYYARWSGAVYKKLFSIVPWRTAGVSIFTLASQLSLLLAFFLPLKVIILIGSTGIPRYFPQAWENVDRDFLVVLLSIAAVAFYIFYMISEKVVDSFADKGAQIVINKSKKMTLFAGQEEFAKGVYQRLSRTLAAGCFFVIVSIFFVLYYPYFLLVLLLYLAGGVVFLSFAVSFSTLLERLVLVDTKALVNTASGVGFLFLFIFMVADFILWQGVGVMVAIISLLLSRQLFQKLTGALNDGVDLYKKRVKINALFFHGHALVNSESEKATKSLWRFLDKSIQKYEVLSFFQQQLNDGDGFRLSSMRLIQPEQLGVLCFIVSLDVKRISADEVCEDYLLKVYDTSKKNLAIRENDILEDDFSPPLPRLERVAIGDISGYTALAYKMCDVTGISPKRPDAFKILFMADCWSSKPSKEFLDRYLRSHPLLSSRLSGGMLNRLEAVASNSTGLADVERFKNVFQEIRELLDALPLCVKNSSVNKFTLFEDDQGCVLASSWEHWSIEPLGAGFPITETYLKRLPELMERATKTNPDLGGVNLQTVVLSAYIAHFERLCIRHQYLEAIGLIPFVLETLEKIHDSQSSLDG